MLTESKLLRICLIAFVVSSCDSAPKFPTDRIFEVDLNAGVCGEYKIIDFKNLKVRHLKDHPLSKCGGVFGFSTRDIPKVLDWGVDVREWGERRCK